MLTVANKSLAQTYFKPNNADLMQWQGTEEHATHITSPVLDETPLSNRNKYTLMQPMSPYQINKGATLQAYHRRH
jgi:hypothetical protein